jgi:hypothetical protein
MMVLVSNIVDIREQSAQSAAAEWLCTAVKLAAARTKVKRALWRNFFENFLKRCIKSLFPHE